MEPKANNRIELVDAVEELESKALLPIQTAETFLVNSKASLEEAAEIVRILKELQDEVSKVFDPLVEAAYKSHRAATQARKHHLEPLQRATYLLRGRMDAYVSQQRAMERAAEEARRKAEEEARAKALEGYLPRSQPKLSAAEHQAPFPPKFGIDETAPLPPPLRVEGLPIRDIWKWRLVDASLIPAEFWILDDKAISAVVGAQKDKTSIPGVEVYPESKVSVKRET